MTDQIRVLHVDPEPESAALITEYFERDDSVVVETAVDGEAGLDLLASIPIHCVVSEQVLPDRTGIELLEEVREDHPQLPFVLYTDEESERVEREAFSAGATDHLPKRAGSDRHERVVERVLAAVERTRAVGGTPAEARRHALASDVNEALVRATTAADAVDRVCERLVDADPFSAAGVGTFDAEAGDIAFESLLFADRDPSSGAGDGSTVGDGSGALESAAEDAARAASEDGATVVWTDGSARSGAGEYPRSVEELAAVPIEVTNAVHGVLVVTADRDGAIGRPERTLLERLADNLAHALRAFETREQLHEERDRRRALFANAPSPVIEGEILDGGDTHRIRAVNAAFEETFGYEQPEVAGADIADVVVPPERLADHRALRSRIAEGESILEEVVRETADGEREFLLSGIPWGTDGEIADGWYVWHIDISERKRRANAIERLHSATGALVEAATAEAVAQITADALRDVLDLPLNGVHLHDEREDELVPVAWTDETEEVIGHPPTFASGEGIAGRTYESGEPRVYDDIADVSERYNPETPVRSEMVLPLSDHGVLLVGASEPDAFDDLDVSMARTLAEHATAVLHRIEREHVLEELQDRTRQLMQASTRDAIAEIAVETANETLGAQLSGVHFARSGGRQLELTAHADSVETSFDELPIYDRGVDDDPASDFVWEAFDSGEPRSIDDIRTHERLAAETPSRSVIVHPLNDHGVFIVSSTEPNAFDETDKTFTEVLATAVAAALDRVEHERELRRQNEQLDEFAGLISHDLRNPLNVAQGRVMLAREETDTDHLDSAASAIDRALSLLEESLAIARQGHDDSDVEPVELASVVSECWAHTDTAEAELTVETDRTVPADPSRLKQLLENLIRNAVKHGGDDVRITVGDIPGGFYVADDGPGIPDDERERVFEVGHTTDDESTGYGLYIVREIAEAHGWDISIADGEAGGARFEVVGVDSTGT
ncbi:GAF domain-containing protein [Halobaculum rubrum]|uniref:GAF domain-containing protein n=1 Tax=Halobaculum rubrum TaxID=2872158 RepID=UPI001CA3FF94|nr:GAF domain-containing protein [Halobaculum rubrum]QZX99121.1 GAF domain-containing protein [Halobaculum rubrum]